MVIVMDVMILGLIPHPDASGPREAATMSCRLLPGVRVACNSSINLPNVLHTCDDAGWRQESLSGFRVEELNPKPLTLLLGVRFALWTPRTNPGYARSS